MVHIQYAPSAVDKTLSDCWVSVCTITVAAGSLCTEAARDFV